MSRTNAVTAEIDNNGNEVYPDACSHAYGYDASGRLTTDTITNVMKTATWVKTYSYNASGQLTSESVWVKQ